MWKCVLDIQSYRVQRPLSSKTPNTLSMHTREYKHKGGLHHLHQQWRYVSTCSLRLPSISIKLLRIGRAESSSLEPKLSVSVCGERKSTWNCYSIRNTIEMIPPVGGALCCSQSITWVYMAPTETWNGWHLWSFLWLLIKIISSCDLFKTLVYTQVAVTKTDSSIRLSCSFYLVLINKC